MLYDILIITLALIIPVSAFFSFRAGYKAGRTVKEEKPMQPIVSKARDKPTQEQQRMNTILANIDAYDGTGGGQVKL